MIGLRSGVRTLRRDERADAAVAHDLHRRHATSIRIRRPSSSAEITLLAAEEMRRFGIVPEGRVPVAFELRIVVVIRRRRRCRPRWRWSTAMDPDLECEGEMHGDAALDEEVRIAAFPNSRLKGEANLLIMPTLDAANISFNLLKVSSGAGVTLGPILLGVAKPVHILTPVGDGAPHRQHDGADVRRLHDAAAGATHLAAPARRQFNAQCRRISRPLRRRRVRYPADREFSPAGALCRVDVPRRRSVTQRFDHLRRTRQRLASMP